MHKMSFVHSNNIEKLVKPMYIAFKPGTRFLSGTDISLVPVANGHNCKTYEDPFHNTHQDKHHGQPT